MEKELENMVKEEGFQHQEPEAGGQKEDRPEYAPFQDLANRALPEEQTKMQHGKRCHDRDSSRGLPLGERDGVFIFTRFG